MNLVKYSNVFTEVYVILSHLETSDYEKIPVDVIKTIENNRNLNYNYVMNEEIDIDNQLMLPQTKAMLFNIFRDYLATEEQREKIKRMQKEDVIRLMKAKKSYNANLSSVLKQKTNDKPSENVYIIEAPKENFLTKILKRIKSIFK